MKEGFMHIHHTIGIAGHIDHGKTSLTRAMTGVETDRLKEEKERNISIELGFAPCTLPDGQTVGLVDVPGHERFIRQMIAGAAGIDLVVLVIAADEGVMPQTREHGEILGYLGIQKGIIVLTKIDMVDQEWLAMEQEEVREWAKGTFLENAPIFPVSSKTNDGIDPLLQNIARQLHDVPPRPYTAPFRMPIDRAFTIKGTGTVVTGTIYEGTVKEEERLELLPGGQEVRVRRVQVHNQKANYAFAGQRAALNITGVDLNRVSRGMSITALGFYHSTRRIDVRFQFSKHLNFPLKQRSKVRLHIGTSEVDGTLIFFDRNSLDPGEEVLAQLYLEKEITAKKGDAFILRRPTPAVTLGGGQVVDPYGERHSFGENTISHLQRLAKGDPKERILQFIETRQFSTKDELMQRLVMGKEETEFVLGELVKSEDILTLTGDVTGQPGGSNTIFVDKSAFQQWLNQLKEELNVYHSRNPLRKGMSKAAIKSARFHFLTDRIWRYFLIEADSMRLINEEGDVIWLYDFTPHPPEKYREACTAIVKGLIQAGLTPPSWTALLNENKLPEHIGADFQSYLMQRKEILPLTDDLYIIRKEWDQGVEKLLQASPKGTILTPAVAKEVLGLSRKYLIPFLESLDVQKLTKRTEEGRVWIHE